MHGAQHTALPATYTATKLVPKPIHKYASKCENYPTSVFRAFAARSLGWVKLAASLMPTKTFSRAWAAPESSTILTARRTKALSGLSLDLLLFKLALAAPASRLVPSVWYSWKRSSGTVVVAGRPPEALLCLEGGRCNLGK